MALPFEIYPAFAKAKQMIENGVIGKVASADGMFAHQGPLHAPWFLIKSWPTGECLQIWGFIRFLFYPIYLAL